eukprot:XP_011431781.1 PREDICTED: uncharacterized protein LOC105331338 [Crassostrea gigas]
MKFYEILFVISLLLMIVIGKPARKPRRLKLSTDKPITTEATTISVILNTTSVILDITPANKSPVDSNNDCLDCVKDIELVPITEKPTIVIGDVLCAFCQQYLDPVEKEECIKKNCAGG